MRLTEPQWQIETFTDVLPSDALTQRDWEREASEYEVAGLDRLARLSRQHLRAPATGRLMTPDELRVWVWRYPTVYATHMDPFMHRDRIQSTWPWAELAWPVPTEIRQLITASREAYDRLEIWTPELRRLPVIGVSPILVGVRGGESYLLARWAEALEPFEDIRAKMAAKPGRRATKIRKRIVDPDDEVPIGFSSFLAGAAAFVAAAFSYNEYWTIGGIGAGISALATWWMIAEVRLRTRRARQWACSYAGWVMPNS